MNAEVKTVVAADEHRGLRVDQCLKVVLPEFSRARLQQLIEAGQVHFHDKPVKASHRVQPGDVLRLEIPPPVESELVAQDLPLTVLHEDKDIIVINKAPGVVVHPGAGHHDGTLVNALLHHVTDLQQISGTVRPGLVHRLDKDTSGVLVVAKNEKALLTLQAEFKNREVAKVYRALVLGEPPEALTLSTPYGRHPRQRLKFTSKAGPKTAVTHFTVREQFQGAADLEVRLETGRTHQIRVHLTEAGYPLIGDTLYGPRAAQRPELIERQALHAWKIEFTHPKTRKVMQFEARLPSDYAKAVKALRGPKLSK